MARIDLKVPFSEKDEAKSLGARWDPSLKTWYIPEGVDISPLAQWLPVTEYADLEHGPEFSVRAPYYYVIESVSDCWGCSNLTRVFSFKLPEQHEEFDYYEGEDEDFALTSNLGNGSAMGIAERSPTSTASPPWSRSRSITSPTSSSRPTAKRQAAVT
ncbi:DUF5710 domain-containing protein [Pseudomonas brassicacearum]|uniref:DUF5710 domain-containing protein n=1 Tax=Pseudomonas brassicacearum TaxID=930166 RepID=UPI00209FC1A7|nr:DUF5710 domain-containing protein [Pseudomonas brassicacearum]